MRRIDREITDFDTIVSMIDECMILRIGLSDGDCPYIVPLNFSYTIKDKEIYFYIHGAMAGRKYELLNKNKVCSFEMDRALKMDCLTEKKDVTMRYKSVMGECSVRNITDPEEKKKIVDTIIMNRYEQTRGFQYNEKVLPRTAIFELKVMQLSAKANLLNSGADVE